MKISEVIARLEALQEEYGDLPLYIMMECGEIALCLDHVGHKDEWKFTESITYVERLMLDDMSY